MRTLAATALAAIALLAPTLSTTGAPANAATATTPTMLILDASGSMVRDAPGGGTRMDQARQAATTFVDSLDDAQQLGLMVFGTQTGNTDAEQAAGCQDVRTVVPLGTVDKGRITTEIGGLRASGFTPLGLSVERAAEALPTGEPSTIVLVSDGVDVCAPPPSCDRAQAVKAANPRLTIHAIGFAVDADEAAQEELTCIARVGGGQYVTASNAAQLVSQLQIAVDPSLLRDTVTAIGVNDLRLGMTIDEVRQAVPDLVTTDPTLEIVYAECAYATFRFTGGVLYDIYPKAQIPTSEGVAIGDDVASATAVYGEPIASGTGDLGAFVTYETTPGAATGYRIYVEGHRIVRIVVCVCGTGTLVRPPGGGGAAGDPLAPVSFDGIGALRLGMSVAEYAALRPDALVDGEGSTIASVAGTFTDGCVGEGSPASSIDHVARFAGGRLVGVIAGAGSSWIPDATGATRGAVEATFGRAMVLPGQISDDPGAHGRWIAADARGHTVQVVLRDLAAGTAWLVAVADATTTVGQSSGSCLLSPRVSVDA